MRKKEGAMPSGSLAGDYSVQVIEMNKKRVLDALNKNYRAKKFY